MKKEDMKILKTVMLSVVLLLVPAYAFSSHYGYMRASFIEGDVQIKTPEAGDWGYASINTPLAEGDQVWVPQGGRAELQLNSGTYIRLDENTALQILAIDKHSSQFYLSQGYAYIFYDAPRGSVIQVDTPDASTRAFNRATFRIDMSDRYTDVSVYKGYVETENQVGTTRINAGSMVSLGQNTNGEVAPLGQPDEWERWNETRDDRIYAGGGVSSRYLPAELRPYSYDFDNSGRWVQVPEYGYVWTPTIVIGVSWSPYRNGRWIWRGDDYVWVGYEPWGWAPYHYGRWSFVVNIGWFWVPPVAREVYWSPGYVGWVRTNDYVAWVPLAPGEIYYGRGYYGRHSVNITNVNINQVNITNVYKNVYINNGATIVDRKTFATGSPKIVNVHETEVRKDIFTKKNFRAGAHDIKPTRASYFTSDKSIPQVKLPPQRVRNVHVRELKQSRRLIKEPEKSVLNPGGKPETLPLTKVTTPRTRGKGKPSIQQIQPEEKRKPVVPEGAPAPRGERQIKPSDNRPAVTESGTAPRGERKQVKPDKKGKSGAPEKKQEPEEPEQ
ncbi:MAG: FecR domain-containing protein [Nitrospirae bacterium]|nr:FecR domain-containing protein [Nitrospirota bacterium]